MNWYAGCTVSKPCRGIAFCTRGSWASKVMMLSTPMLTSSCSASAQSRDSREVLLCWRLSYRKGMMTVIRRALPPTAAWYASDPDSDPRETYDSHYHTGNKTWSSSVHLLTGRDRYRGQILRSDPLLHRNRNGVLLRPTDKSLSDKPAKARDSLCSLSLSALHFTRYWSTFSA